MSSGPSKLVRFFKRMSEKLFGTWKEGPEPPDRIADMVIVFANMNPHATRLDWVRFATFHARECYRSGWVRGMENVERDEHAFDGIDPDQLMDEANGVGWRELPVGPNMEPPGDSELHNWEWYAPGGVSLEGDVVHAVKDYEDENRIAWEQLERMEREDEQRGRDDE